MENRGLFTRRALALIALIGVGLYALAQQQHPGTEAVEKPVDKPIDKPASKTTDKPTNSTQKQQTDVDPENKLHRDKEFLKKNPFPDAVAGIIVMNGYQCLKWIFCTTRDRCLTGQS